MVWETSMVIFGISLIVIDAMFFGLGSFVLVFIGISMILTGVLTFLGLVPDTWEAQVMSSSLLTIAVAVVGWKPLKRLQAPSQSVDEQPNIDGGMRFFLNADITIASPGEHEYSGVTWKVKIDRRNETRERIEKGEEVVVTKSEVGALLVKSVS